MFSLPSDNMLFQFHWLSRYTVHPEIHISLWKEKARLPDNPGFFATNLSLILYAGGQAGEISNVLVCYYILIFDIIFVHFTIRRRLMQFGNMLRRFLIHSGAYYFFYTCYIPFSFFLSVLRQNPKTLHCDVQLSFFSHFLFHYTRYRISSTRNTSGKWNFTVSQMFHSNPNWQFCKDLTTCNACPNKGIS